MPANSDAPSALVHRGRTCAGLTSPWKSDRPPRRNREAAEIAGMRPSPGPLEQGFDVGPVGHPGRGTQHDHVAEQFHRFLPFPVRWVRKRLSARKRPDAAAVPFTSSGEPILVGLSPPLFSLLSWQKRLAPRHGSRSRLARGRHDGAGGSARRRGGHGPAATFVPVGGPRRRPPPARSARRRWQKDNAAGRRRLGRKSCVGKEFSADAPSRPSLALQKCNDRVCFAANCGPCLLRQIVGP